MISFVLKPTSGFHVTKKNNLVIRKSGSRRFIGQNDKAKAAERSMHLQSRTLLTAYGPLPLIPEGACCLDLTFVFPIPPSREDLKIGDPHVQVPDGLNLAALVSDALQGICYSDDSALVTTTATKIYGSDCRIECTIKRWEPTA